MFSHDGQPIGRHQRCWGQQQTITDPTHVETAAVLRARYQDQQRRGRARRHEDGHLVQIRPLTDYDALFGVDFTRPQQEGASRS